MGNKQTIEAPKKISSIDDANKVYLARWEKERFSLPCHNSFDSNYEDELMLEALDIKRALPEGITTFFV